jgi:hypothetical protein
MIAADRGAFLDIVLGFAEIHSKQLSVPALNSWWNAMSPGWSIDEFRQAANHLLRTLKFMPSPADFENLRKAGRPTAGEAFAQAVEASKSCAQGGYFTDNVASGDRLTDRVVRAIGGYRVIAMSEVDKLHFLERRFTEHYETMQDADHVREALPQLARGQPATLTSVAKIAAKSLRAITTQEEFL